MSEVNSRSRQRRVEAMTSQPKDAVDSGTPRTALRTLAEQAVPIWGNVLTDEDGDKQLDFQRAANPQRIIELLDERDDLEQSNAALVTATEIVDVALLTSQRRVAALEEGLRALLGSFGDADNGRDIFVNVDRDGIFNFPDDVRKARALLSESEASDE